MKTLATLFLGLGLSLGMALTTGCAAKIEPLAADDTLMGVDYTILKDAGLVRHAGELSGEGSVVFSKLLVNGLQSDQHFDVSFRLEDGGSLTLALFSGVNASNAQDADPFTGGYRVQLVRTGETLQWFEQEGSDVATRKDLPDRLERLNSVPIVRNKRLPSASGIVQLQIEIHNGHGHRFFWINDANTTADFKRPEYETAGKVEAGDARWGLKLQGAKVFRASVSEAKFED